MKEWIWCMCLETSWNFENFFSPFFSACELSWANCQVRWQSAGGRDLPLQLYRSRHFSTDLNCTANYSHGERAWHDSASWHGSRDYRQNEPGDDQYPLEHQQHVSQPPLNIHDTCYRLWWADRGFRVLRDSKPASVHPTGRGCCPGYPAWSYSLQSQEGFKTSPAGTGQAEPQPEHYWACWCSWFDSQPAGERDFTNKTVHLGIWALQQHSKSGHIWWVHHTFFNFLTSVLIPSNFSSRAWAHSANIGMLRSKNMTQ